MQSGEALAAAKEEIIVQRRFDHPCLVPLLGAATVDVCAAGAGASAFTATDDGDDTVPTQHVLMLFPAYLVRSTPACTHPLLAWELDTHAVSAPRALRRTARCRTCVTRSSAHNCDYQLWRCYASSCRWPRALQRCTLLHRHSLIEMSSPPTCCCRCACCMSCTPCIRSSSRAVALLFTALAALALRG